MIIEKKIKTTVCNKFLVEKKAVFNLLILKMCLFHAVNKELRILTFFFSFSPSFFLDKTEKMN